VPPNLDSSHLRAGAARVAWKAAAGASLVVVRRSVARALERDDRPGDQITALERKTDCLPALGAKMVEAVRAQVSGVLLEIASIFEGND
jgi:hypothetical protein